MVIALSCHEEPVTQKQVFTLVTMTPQDRLREIKEALPETKTLIDDMLDQYSWFLEKTNLSTPEIEEYFRDKKNRIDAFAKGNQYGDLMYDLLSLVDKKFHCMRHLVV